MTEFEKYLMQPQSKELDKVWGEKEELSRKLRHMELKEAFEAGQKASKWILCSERLPEDDSYKMVTDGYFLDKSCVVNKEWKLPQGMVRTVIAWQPLPEIPEDLKGEWKK